MVAILLLARWFGAEMTINHEGQHVTVILPPNHLATYEISTKKSTRHHIQLFRERLLQKLCTRQSRKVIWDMINTLVLETVAVEPTFVTFF